MKITTIIFDLSEVFLYGMKGVDNIIQKKYSLNLPEKPLLIPAATDFFLGRISEDDYWRAVNVEYNLQIPLSELKELVRSNFTEIEGTRDIITSLKEQKYKLGLLSIHGREWIDHCERKFDYHKLFDSVMYSFQVEVSKPDLKAYELMLESLSVSAEETLFVDDSQKNLQAAEKLGISTILFTSPENLIEDLSKEGITVRP